MFFCTCVIFCPPLAGFKFFSLLFIVKLFDYDVPWGRFLPFHVSKAASLVAQTLMRLPTMWETQVQSLGQEDPLEKEMATHCSIHAWKTPRTEEPGGLQSMGSQRVRHNGATKYTHA